MSIYLLSIFHAPYMKPNWVKSRTLYVQNYLFAMTIRYSTHRELGALRLRSDWNVSSAATRSGRVSPFLHVP